MSTHVAHAATPTLCQPDEVTYFSCQLKGAKIVSICGSGQVERSNPNAHRASWLQYRMGKPTALELVFPRQTANSVSKFEGESRHGAGVTINALDFSIHRASYSVEHSHSELTQEGFTGVRVNVGGKETQFACHGEAILDEEFDLISEELAPAPG